MHQNRVGLLIALSITIVLSFGVLEFLSVLNSNLDSLDTTYRRNKRAPNLWPRMDDKTKDIFWIVQISDIHLSLFRDPSRGPDLVRLCKEYLKLIYPKTVIVTGDLTDAVIKKRSNSRQFIEEWVRYKSAVDTCSDVMKAKWVDVRGNHDCFDVKNFSSANNYYRHYSALGHVHRKKKNFEQGFVHNIILGPGASIYSFIGIDTCPRPGPNKPFNYFGYIDEDQSQQLKYLSALTAHSNHTVWFGHYPTSFIVQSPPILREIMRGSIMYLCGHLHTMRGLVPRMYAKHKTGQLELELGDWKDNRIFRLIAFDHDLVSFTDAKLGQWPIILITNPKDNQYLSPSIEPVEMIAFSTHIRILVFSQAQIKQVSIHIDEKFQGLAEQSDPSSPLYVLEWKPARYSKGTHKISVTVLTGDKNAAFVYQHFSVDGEEIDSSLVPKLLLMLNIYTVGKCLFGVLVVAYVMAFTILNQCYHIRPYLLHGRSRHHIILNSIFKGTWLASKVTPLLYLLVGSALYLAFGPWFIGYLLTDHLGIVFAWGIIINNSFIPGGQTYMSAIYQFLTFNLPMTWIVGHILDQRLKYGGKFLLRRNFPVILLILLFYAFTINLAFGDFVQAYGWTAFVLGFLRTGNLLLLPSSVLLALHADVEVTFHTCTF